VSEKLDMFLKLYELNEDYHDKKEQMVWLGATLYLSFVVASCGWLLGHDSLCTGFWPYLVGFLCVIFGLTCWYVYQQAWHKARTNARSAKMNAVMLQFTEKSSPTFEAIRKANTLPLKVCRQSWGPDRFMFAFISVFFIAQILIVLHFAGIV